ncbi:ABC-2 family transporter protein [Thermosyntropha lipolytica DSM 11003]|uniref:ABC-2 family transporter protein n=1 Tax=Thermosyntropha lipolytica DSM 11003 TaxID=1123382 RepID=A0A1M5S1X3_9FIRM|nr:ABC-2 transporter permease [Thermosyntropha lipolytica]SHH32454.1 ABC-2 family transporter protein [Thermosyntropha lipolytica DSM 11003]
MYSLILKDLLLQKKFFIFAFFYIPIMILFFGEWGDVAAITAMVYIMVQTACAYDDKNRGDVLLNSLPLRRGWIVGERYLSTAVFFIIILIIYGLSYAILSLLPLPVVPVKMDENKLIGSFFSVLLLTMFYYPVYFKFGYMKSRLVNLIIFFMIFGGSIWLASMEEEIEGFIDVLVRVFGIGNQLAIGLILLTFIIFLVITSFVLSLAFYRQRDF